MWRFRSSECRYGLLTITRKKVPPLQEFVLRAIGAGLVHEADIAGFLGLERDVVRRTLSELVGMDAVLLGGGAGDRTHRLVLTEQGRGTLNTLTLERADEETQTFFLDGLTRRLVPEPANPLRSGSDLRKVALIEIAPYPRTRPEADEFREQLLSEWGTLHPDSEVVAVLGVERSGCPCSGTTPPCANLSARRRRRGYARTVSRSDSSSAVIGATRTLKPSARQARTAVSPSCRVGAAKNRRDRTDSCLLT